MSEAFHEGERFAQEVTGMRDLLASKGSRLIREELSDQHQQFFAQLPFVLIGVLDAAGQPWAGVLANPPGFISSPDARTLQVLSHAGQFGLVAQGLAQGAFVGLLGIEPHTRRRNRANGIIERLFDDGFTIGIRQSFGNCPKYIQARKASYFSRTPNPKPVEMLPKLDAVARALILGADTFFIATAYLPIGNLYTAGHGVDISHRGGPPGFVDIDSEGVLSIPDFIGNYFFNTIGNLALNPRAGLLFIDFKSGDQLHLAVDAEVVWNKSSATENSETTTRRLRFRVKEIRRIRASLSLHWEQES